MKLLLAIIISICLTFLAGVYFIKQVFVFSQLAREANRDYETVRTCQYLSAMTERDDWGYGDCLEQLNNLNKPETLRN